MKKDLEEMQQMIKKPAPPPSHHETGDTTQTMQEAFMNILQKFFTERVPVATAALQKQVACTAPDFRRVKAESTDDMEIPYEQTSNPPPTTQLWGK